MIGNTTHAVAVQRNLEKICRAFLEFWLEEKIFLSEIEFWDAFLIHRKPTPNA
jgi:hypothetical protein